MDERLIEAIAFFDNKTLTKEMLYPEFEAVLDHVVSIAEFSDRTIEACYLRIDSGLHIRAAVSFLLYFDSRGYADTEWNLPLQYLADKAGSGPDLGAGPIKLACKSQCPVSWHQRGLWDPESEEGQSTVFQQLSSAIKANRLGLDFGLGDEDNSLDELGGPLAAGAMSRKALSKAFDKRLEAQLREHKLSVETVKSKAKERLEDLQSHYQQKIQQLTHALTTTKQLFVEEKNKNLALSRIQKNHNEEIQQAKDRLKVQAAAGQQAVQKRLTSLEDKFSEEVEQRVESSRQELQERLQMREVELFYRDEQIKRLNDDLSLLRQQKNQLSDNVWQNMSEAGISFVAHKLGLEHLQVPLKDMEEYLLSPLEYWHKHTGLDIQRYQAWLQHRAAPVCGAQAEGNKLCNCTLPREESYADFIDGRSNRCEAHREFAPE